MSCHPEDFAQELRRARAAGHPDRRISVCLSKTRYADVITASTKKNKPVIMSEASASLRPHLAQENQEAGRMDVCFRSLKRNFRIADIHVSRLSRVGTGVWGALARARGARCQVSPCARMPLGWWFLL
ncbi:MAG TPA: hypothetical protein VHZ25_14960, partial [Acidobacteriaceae bacterium]|nr:hypothetical protein [Acidobacteriaceae bacterium]